jgi:carboxypeptidase Taq
MSYATLAERFKRLSHLRHVEAMVSWDEAAMMPTGGGAARGEALSTLRGLIHQHATHPEFAALFAAAEREAADLGPWEQANLREMRREWTRAAALPNRLVEAMSRAESRSEQAWRHLRAQNDFAGFLPHFREVIALKREAAQALGAALSLAPYDALMDGFEPGYTVEKVRPLFARLRAFLPGFIAQALDRQGAGDAPLAGPFPPEAQRALGLALMGKVGFDFDHGRLDTSHHPFCGGVPEDVRITTRYDPGDFGKAMMGVLHETGHAKYEQNLPPAWRGQPVGAARGMGIHESQSLFLEMQVCRSRAFWAFAAPLVAESFPAAARANPAAFTPPALFRRAARVAPGFIRVDADEVTYPCHVILRFDLERGLIEGTLRPEDVPEAWDAAMRELLGLSTRGNDRNGCLQDVHWPAGLFGYFPSYTLGALTAAQLFQALRRDLPDVRAQIGQGDFHGLDGWLRAQVWGQGSFLSTTALVERATGKPLGTEAFEAHLAYRYLEHEQ